VQTQTALPAGLGDDWQKPIRRWERMEDDEGRKRNELGAQSPKPPISGKVEQ